MIVVPEERRFLLITQPDHAWFAAELMSLWRAEGVPDHPRRADLLFAVREHDNGWREADAAPRWDPEKRRPHDFLSMPRQEKIGIWERGTARFARQHPYAALLIVLHAINLHRDRAGEEGWTEFLDRMLALEGELRQAADASEDEAAADYKLLDRADLISLAVCNDWGDRFDRHGMRGRVRDGTVFLDPFPLAGATTFRIPCRRIPARPYDGDADLGGDLASARWEELRVRVAPG